MHKSQVFGIRVTDRCTEENKGRVIVLVTRYPGKRQTPPPRPHWRLPCLVPRKGLGRQQRAWRELIAQGVDPKVREEERRPRRRPPKDRHFCGGFSMPSMKIISRRFRTGDDVKKAITKHVLAAMGERGRPISEIRPGRCERARSRLFAGTRQSGPIAFPGLPQENFFGWAVDQELIEASPAAAVKRPSKEVKRDRVLTDTEIWAIWQASGELGTFGRAFPIHAWRRASADRRSEK